MALTIIRLNSISKLLTFAISIINIIYNLK